MRMRRSSIEIERLRTERRRHGPQNTNNLIPAIKLLIGDWYVDELGILTREIRRATRLAARLAARLTASRLLAKSLRRRRRSRLRFLGYGSTGVVIC